MATSHATKNLTEMLIQLKFFGGQSSEETAEVIGISPATVKREWALAKSWLFRERSW